MALSSQECSKTVLSIGRELLVVPEENLTSKGTRSSQSQICDNRTRLMSLDKSRLHEVRVSLQLFGAHSRIIWTSTSQHEDQATFLASGLTISFEDSLHQRCIHHTRIQPDGSNIRFFQCQYFDEVVDGCLGSTISSPSRKCRLFSSVRRGEDDFAL